MAGPQVRGDIKVSRNVQARKVRQGTRNFVAASGAATLQLNSGDPYSIVIGASGDSTAAAIRLPIVVEDSSENPASPSVPQIHIPVGPQSGIGTEFRITNLSGGAIPVANANGTAQIAGGLPNGNTAIAYCTAATAVENSITVGTWHVYVVDASTTNLTPNNIVFTEGVGTPATSTLTLAGAATTDGAITVNFTNDAAASYSVTSTVFDTETATTAASNLASALNADVDFAEFYTSVANGLIVSITAIDNGPAFNAATVTVASTATGLTIASTPLANGSGNSWTHDTTNNIYTYLIAQVRHRRGLDPIYEVFEHESSDANRTKVLIESRVNVSSGAITLTVNDTPDGTFAGSVDVL